MFLGHLAVAFAAKRAAPSVSLVTLAFATQFLDELWPFLLLAGVEHARIVPGLTAANPIDLISYPISHSLLMAAVWGIVVGAIHFAFRRDVRSAIVIGCCVLSHWFLDAIVHRPDLPLWPGSDIKVGAELWRSIPLTLVLEIGLFFIGLTIYLRSTCALDRAGKWGPAAIVALGLFLQFYSIFGPPPMTERALAFTMGVLVPFLPLTWWVDRHRSYNYAGNDARFSTAGDRSLADSASISRGR